MPYDTRLKQAIKNGLELRKEKEAKEEQDLEIRLKRMEESNKIAREEAQKWIDTKMWDLISTAICAGNKHIVAPSTLDAEQLHLALNDIEGIHYLRLQSNTFITWRKQEELPETFSGEER